MIRARQDAIKLLRSWRRFIDNIARRWETAGHEIPIEQIRDVLFVLEQFIDIGVFEKSESVDHTDAFEVENEFEVEMIHKGVRRLRDAATPVLEDAAADREAQQLRNTFAVVDGLMRRAG